MDKRYIVAIEIGSSKIKGMVACIGDLGEINVIDIEETLVKDCVRYGRIQNVQEVSSHVNDILRKIENNPRVAPRKVTDIFISLGGRSLSTVIAQAQQTFPNAIEISAETVDRLKRDASFSLVTDKTTLEMLPHAFFVDNSEVRNVVGTIGNSLRAEFTAIVISAANQNNLDRIKFDGVNPARHYIIRPTALADLVLNSNEKQLGCALVDFGAETTTIAIYKDNVLQSIITLPVGSRNITRDLMAGLSMTEEQAENAKAEVGSAITGDSASASSASIEINNYISARAGEIVANILHQIDVAGFRSALPSGIVLTGGGARLHNFDRLLETQSKMPVRIASVESSLQFKSNGFDRAGNIDLLALAKYVAENSDVNCLFCPVNTDNQVNDDYTDDTVTPDSIGHTKYGPRHIDDDNLLDDDPDPVDEPSAGHRGIVRGVTRGPQETDSDDNDIDVAPKKPSRIGRLKECFANFMYKRTDDEDEDDLDSRVD